jgi:hypothetical protein
MDGGVLRRGDRIFLSTSKNAVSTDGIVGLLCLSCYCIPTQLLAIWSNVADNPEAARALITGRIISAVIFAGFGVFVYRAKTLKTYDILTILGFIVLIFNTLDMQTFANKESVGLVFRAIVVMLLVLFMFEVKFIYLAACYVVLAVF